MNVYVYVNGYVNVYVFVCVGREFLIQGFVSHRLEAVNSVVLKIPMCSSALWYNLISLYLNKTLPDLTPLVGYFRIFGMVQHFHFSLFFSLRQLRCFAVMGTAPEI